MRLFAYYISHTFINVIKKLLKTWIAFFLIVAVFGALVGVISGAVGSAVEKKVQSDKEAEEIAEEESDVSFLESEFGSLFAGADLTKEEIVEIATSVVFLFMLFISLINSKGIGEIFQPADVTMLFSAPLKPQSVMLFRLVTTLGMQFFLSLIMALQLPNLIISAKINAWGACSLLISWIILALFTTLLQVLLYIISSYSEFLKSNLKLFVGVFFGLVAGGYIYNVATHGKNLLMAAKVMFTATWSRWIPFFGWIRGFSINAISGNLIMSFVFLALIIIGLAVMVAVIWNLKVDFYEDAISSTEKKAAALENAKNNQSATRTKERSSRIQRDGFDKGEGANVFFYKTMYNRRRLSLFRGITKTMLLYAGICLFLIVLGEIKDFKYSFYAICAAMALVAFYRTLGNPLREDITKGFFAMIPASAKSKLFWSLLGGLTNSLLDMMVPYLISVVYLKVDILEAVLWLVFILTIDLYGTIVGTFIYLSVSVSLTETVQKMIQIVFIYFGVLPAVAFVLCGIVLDKVLLLMPIGIVFNMLMSLLFFLIVPKLMENGR